MIGTPRSSSPGLGISQDNVLSRADIGMKVLDLYAAILCDPATPSEMYKFAKTVTNKVSEVTSFVTGNTNRIVSGCCTC